jgi:hypothetical protein
MKEEEVNSIIKDCTNYIESLDYRSYDLFDALTNPVIDFMTSPFPLLRRVANQVNSKSPVDLHWLGMKKMVHTKLISDLVSLFSILNSKDRATTLYLRLIEMGNTDIGLDWGLNFPYTNRFVNASPTTPNIYNTSASGLAICELAEIDGDNYVEYRLQIEKIVKSLFSIFGYHDESSLGWFSYYPGQKYPTYNVNALTIYFLCKANYSLKSEFVKPEIVEKVIQLLIREQNEDGSWYYSRSEKGKWIDGFHTGFIIESLAYVYSHGFKSTVLLHTIERAWDYYISNMFTEEGCPKYFSNSGKFPVEAQNCAQAIQTLSLVGLWMDWDQRNLLEKVISNTISDLYSAKGYFYYKRTSYFTNKSSYLRWSTSPMILALANANIYLNKNSNKQSSL